MFDKGVVDVVVDVVVVVVLVVVVVVVIVVLTCAQRPPSNFLSFYMIALGSLAFFM